MFKYHVDATEPFLILFFVFDFCFQVANILNKDMAEVKNKISSIKQSISRKLKLISYGKVYGGSEE